MGPLRDWPGRESSSTPRPNCSPDGLAKVTFCLDPDGTFIELVEMLEVAA